MKIKLEWPIVQVETREFIIDTVNRPWLSQYKSSVQFGQSYNHSTIKGIIGLIKRIKGKI